MSTETAVAADRFGDAMGALRGVFEGIQLQIGAKLLPALVALTETFGGVFIDGVKAATQSSAGMGEVFDTLVVQIGQAIGRAIEILAKMTDAVAVWAADTTKRVAEQARAFLDLAPAIITVGRALDLALSGGTHESGFDALAKNLEAMRKPLDAARDRGHVGGREAPRGGAEHRDRRGGSGAEFRRDLHAHPGGNLGGRGQDAVEPQERRRRGSRRG
jgi:hypothetical protein